MHATSDDRAHVGGYFTCCTSAVSLGILHYQQVIHVYNAGLQAGQATAKPKPVFGRLEGDFVTVAADVPQKVLSEAKA